MRHEVIPPLSDCVQLSVEQYRSKLYDIIRTEKAVRRQKAESGDKMGERRASSHELSRAKEDKIRGGQEDKGREHTGHLRSDVVRKVNSEVNMRGQSASDNHGLNGGRPGTRRLTTASLRNFEEQRQSLKETLKQGITSGYCYRTTANFIKNKS